MFENVKKICQNLQNNLYKESQPQALRSQSSPRYPLPAALCLVVPASVASDFEEGSSLDVDELSDLIDNASYFLCHIYREIRPRENELDISADEYISPESSQEVYMRVHIEDGRNLIEKNIPYALKTNLQRDMEYKVEKIACLRSLSGLETFNLV